MFLNQHRFNAIRPSNQSESTKETANNNTDAQGFSNAVNEEKSIEGIYT